MKKKLKLWVDITRAYALPQCIMPGALALVLAIGIGDFNWGLGLLAIFACCLVHLAGNMLDDYFDYKYDLLSVRTEMREQGILSFTPKYFYLKDGTLTLAQLGWIIAAHIVVAIAIGVVIFVYRGWSVVAIAAVVGFLTYFYSGWPFKLAFHGFGEIIIGICFGPCLMCGVFESTCGGLYSPETGLYWPIVLMSIAVGIYVTAILYVHSLIERDTDKASDKNTFAVLLGTNKAGLAAFAVMLFLPLLLVVGCVAVGYIHWAYLFVLLQLPRCIWLWRSTYCFMYGIPFDTKNPPKWLGMIERLHDAIEHDVDYYVVRWMCMRNINTGFCFTIVLVKIILTLI